jgi:protein TonB
MLSALPPRPATSDKSDAATTEVATALAAEPPAPPSPPASEVADDATDKVADVLAASEPAPPPAPAPQPEESKKPSPASVAVAAAKTPAPPLPKRKHDVKPIEPVVTASLPIAPKAATPKAPAPAQQEPKAATEPSGGSGRWLPMALAPADKPVLKVPTARPGAGYSSQVWGALARHKPRAGVRGSATVVFSIGQFGGLLGVKIGRSSGNAKIDQLALQTVRSAAPYPAPPSGPATFTIRIDFQ